MFVVLCEPYEDKPDVYGTFSTEESALQWIANDANERDGYGYPPCPNSHYVHEVIEISEG